VNRVYLFSATSHGYANGGALQAIEGYPQRTIFENLDDSKYNRTWGLYFEEIPSAWFMKYTRHFPHRAHGYKRFLEDAANGTLPSFSFVDPIYTDSPNFPGTDQHPDHDVGLGDQLIKQVYEAVRNGPLWNKTMLLITYDEHGGFFDHVGPPHDSPSPDNITAEDCTPPFNFDRLGVRVPAIVVSPWVPKGQVIHEPNTTHFEHSSLSATLLNLLIPDQTFLTARDAWAAPFDFVLSLDKPRVDCPRTIPAAPSHREVFGNLLPFHKIGTRPASHLHKNLVQMASGLNNGVMEHDGEGFTEADSHYYMRDRVNEFLKREQVH
jgi:phospholipase C